MNAWKQVVVFDAGSSGTRVHVFNVLPLAAGQHVPRFDFSVRGAQTLKLKPGLSNFGSRNDLAGAEQCLRQLLDFARGFVPEARRASTPVLLKATAGLRALPPQRAEAVLQTVRGVFAGSGFEFQLSWVDVIRGKEEAGLAWVAANFLTGTFFPQEQRSSTIGSLGIIEMGGGSTQVAFEVEASEQVAGNDEFVFTTATGSQHHLYAHSYLGFGQDYAQEALKTFIQAPKTEDPCYPVGYARNASGPMMKGLQWFVRGSGDADLCKRYIEASLFKTNKEAPGHYPGERPLRGKLLATENFFYLRQNLKLPMLADSQAVADAARTVCSTQAQPHANYCFGLSYQSALLQTLRGAAAPGLQVEIANTINGSAADWALGAALVHVLQSLPHRDGGSSLSGFSGSMAGWALLAAFLVPAASFGFLRRRRCLNIKREKATLSDPEVGPMVVGHRDE